MAVKLNLWSLTLLPGEQYPLYVRRDFTITNAALGEELRSPDGRSVVKVTHKPLPPFDSDSEDDDLGSASEEEMQDEFDLDEEDEGKQQKNGAKVNGAKVNGAKANGVNGDKMGNEGEDDDDDDDDEYSDDEVEETVVLCSLTAGKIEQATLDLTFVQGEGVIFEISGENAVHLVGNYVNQMPYKSDSDSAFSGEDDYSDLEDDDEDDELDETARRFTEIPEAVAQVPVKKSLPAIESKPKDKADAKPPLSKPSLSTPPTPSEMKPATSVETKPITTPAPIATASQKRKADDIESPASKSVAATAASIEGLSKSQKKKLAKKARLDVEGAVKEMVANASTPVATAGSKAAVAGGSKPAAAGGTKPAAAGGAKPQKKTLPTGLIIEDVKVGDGPIAKTGKRLGMRYIGKLESGKQFDANTSGKPFSFVLGKGEVISGWDQGLAGMAVGGERRLTIPAGLAYGNQKLPGIPKASTLRFDVKLVSVI